MLTKIANWPNPEISGKFKINYRRREIRRGAQRFVLQNRSVQVLKCLMDAKPALVLRSELIDQIWEGNRLTGEKGINQALWSIRNALGDDARMPRFIETVPRKGYRWIGWVATDEDRRRSLLSRPVLTALTAMLFLTVTGSQNGSNILSYSQAEAILSPDGIGKAYFSGRDIIVERGSAQRYILKPAGTKSFGMPTYSPDGSSLAFTTSLDGRCELVVLEFSTRTYEKFAPCPVQTSS
ncbi:winged helix-turn-helix domain-containing protein [Sphingorhabdus sp. Alg239-R122]|uniref:winged helix-turn-helix domain-containing protein n=1 Tax=Sphingorhabdus sp. Alg239-R122 TaxID=2305989 RepID=UPI0023DD9E31|nr:winged helix-turn-helix domain-containing protein [Sphingorhabdus sp. Alg239-R122]